MYIYIYVYVRVCEGKMRTTRQILDTFRAAGYKVVNGEVSKNGRVVGGILFGNPNGRVSRVKEGYRYTVEGDSVRWTIDLDAGEKKPDYKVIKRVVIHNHLANK